MNRMCLVCLLFLTFGASAQADTFRFTFSGSVYTGSGIFIATPTTGPSPSVSTFLVTGVSGTSMSSSGTAAIPIVGLAAQSTGAQQNDNLLFFPGVYGNDFFDGNGVAFNLANGVNINLFAYSGISETIPGRGVLPDTGTITVTAVTPEPSTLVLVALPVVLLLTWRFRQVANSTSAAS